MLHYCYLIQYIVIFVFLFGLIWFSCNGQKLPCIYIDRLLKNCQNLDTFVCARPEASLSRLLCQYNCNNNHFIYLSINLQEAQKLSIYISSYQATSITHFFCLSINSTLLPYVCLCQNFVLTNFTFLVFKLHCKIE